MNELTHSNRRQEAKEGRGGEGSRDQAQANGSVYSWMRRKTRQMDEGGVDRQDRMRSWKSATKGHPS